MGNLCRRAGAGRRIAAVAVLPLALFLACRTAAPPPPAGVADDFDAPRPKLVASLLEIAAHRESRGDFDGALHSAERAHAAAPRSGAAALREAELRAAVAIRAGDESGLAEARADVEAIAEQYPASPLPRLARAHVAYAAGDRAGAEKDARALVEERPKWASAQVLLSRIVLDEDPQRALQLAERAVELSPSDPAALGARARARAAFAQDVDASEDARRALRSRADPELDEVLARIALRRGDVHGAVRQIERTLEAERTAALEILLASAETRLEHWDAAESALVRAKTRAGDDAEAQIDAIEASVDLAFARKAPQSALAEVEKARAVGPDDARLAELAALCQLEVGRPADAQASAIRSIELGPGRPSIWYTLAHILEREGAKPPAFERARAALGGADARAHAVAAIVAEQHDDGGAARAEYEAALRADPELAIAKLGLAEQIVDVDPRRALTLAESARAEMGWNVATALALGKTLLANGRTADAVSALRIGLARTDVNSAAGVPVQIALADALIDAGETGEARRVTSRLAGSGQNLDPEPAWLAEVRELQKRLRQLSKAGEGDGAEADPEKPAAEKSEAGADKPATADAPSAPDKTADAPSAPDKAGTPKPEATAEKPPAAPVAPPRPATP